MNKLLIYCLMLCGFVVSAQEKKKEKDKNLPKGNAAYEDKKYSEAEAEYRISKSENPEKSVGAYNLGNAIYRQNFPSEAKAAYLKAVETAKTHEQKHRAFHNLGNVYMKEKKYTEAVAAYKNALRNNPSDEETRYNYALAKKFLKDNPPPKDDKKKDKDKDKKDDKKKDKKDDKNDQKKDEKKDQKSNQDKKPDQPKDNGQPKPKPGGIPKERLQNLLDAVNNQEKKVQEKVNAKKVKGRPVQTEKDW